MGEGIVSKHVLVTGGASGIGLAVAQAFVAGGAKATVSGLVQAQVDAAVALLGAGTIGLACDLTEEGADRRLLDASRPNGPVDYLINSVGIFEVRPFFETTDADWFRYFDVNVMTGVRMSRLILQEMLDRGPGSIVFISSESAVKPQPWMPHYGAMKTCLLGVSRALAELTKGTEVRVNTILPGPTDTEAVRAYHEQIAQSRGISRADVVREYFAETEPTSLIARMISPAEVAESVLHLASSPWLNGMAMRAEGGTIRSVL